MAAFVGLILMVVTWRVDYRRWRSVSLPAMLLTLTSLVLVLVPGFGVANYGAQRWLQVGPLPPLQPSEFAKLGVALYWSDWLARKGDEVRRLGSGTLPFIIALGLVCGLIMLQPDLGTTFVLASMALCIFFVAGANLAHVIPCLIVGAVGLIWATLAAGYRQDRLAAFLDPWSDPQDTGWHTIQTLTALASGGISGLGLGAGRQKFFYVPNAHTDAVYAILGEELGFVGTLGVLLLFGVVVWRGVHAAHRAPDLFGRLLATGITSMIAIQAIVNVAVTTNTLPYTGITLPFMSYGGSSLVVCLTAMGILLNIARQGAAPARTVADDRGAASRDGRTGAGRPQRPRVHDRPLARRPVRRERLRRPADGNA
jgi:cell division protein FtsW